MMALRPIQFGPVAHFTVGMVLTLALAEVSWRAVEAPAHRLKARWAAPDAAPRPAVATVAHLSNSATTGA